MKNKAFLFIILAAILIIVAIIMFMEEVRPYRLADRFSDTSDQGIVVFSFVEVDNYSTNSMNEFTEDFKKEILEDDSYDSEAIMIINYFYMLQDTLPLDDKMKRFIRRQYRHLNDPGEKLYHIENAYQHLATLGDWGQQKIKDTLIKTSFVVPRKGFNAKNLMKKKAPLVDTAKTINQDTIGIKND